MKLSSNTLRLVAAASLASAVHSALTPAAYNLTAYAPVPISRAASAVSIVISTSGEPSSSFASSQITMSSGIASAASFTNSSTTVAPVPVYTTAVVSTSISTCCKGQTVVQSGSTTVLTSPSTTTVRITRTTTIPVTRTLIRSSTIELRPNPSQTSARSSSSQSGPMVSYTNSTTAQPVQPVQPPQTYTVIRLTTIVLNAGQTVTRQGSAVVLPTPSTSTFEATSTWIRSFECTSTTGSMVPIYSTVGVPPPQSYVPILGSAISSNQGGLESTFPTASTAEPSGSYYFPIPVASGLAGSSSLVHISNSPAQGMGIAASSAPYYFPIPVASGFAGSSRLAHSSNSPVQSIGSAASAGAIVPTYASQPLSESSVAPQTNPTSLPATSPVPYPVMGSSTAASFATGTMGVMQGTNSTLSPYIPGSAASGLSCRLDLTGASVAVVAAAVYWIL